MRNIEYMRLADIPAAERNPKTHALGLLVLSIGRFGFADPALLDERTGRLIGGHGRLAALAAIKAYRGTGLEGATAAGYELPAELWAEFDEVTGGADPGGAGEPEGVSVDKTGAWSAPVVRGWSSADDDEAEALLIALNRLPEAGGWDTRGLAEILGGMDADLLEVAGYEVADLDLIVAEAVALNLAEGVDLTPDPDDDLDEADQDEDGQAEADRTADDEAYDDETAAGPDDDEVVSLEGGTPPVRKAVRDQADRAEARPVRQDPYRQQWGLLITCSDEDHQARALAELRHHGYRVEAIKS